MLLLGTNRELQRIGQLAEQTTARHVSVPPADELALALQFARAEKSEATRRAYGRDFRAFKRWCEARGLSPLPASPAAVATFLAVEAKGGANIATIRRRVAGIRYAHLLRDFEPPTNAQAVKATLRGIRRTIDGSPNRKAPITAELVRAMVDAAPHNLSGLRDQALLLLGFAGALRRSELVALDVGDLQESEDGLRLRIRKSKTDQEGKGAFVAILPGHAVCPIRAVKAWLTAAKIAQGPVFRSVHKGGRVASDRLSDRSVAEIVKAYAESIGLDRKSFSGHSLRAGFLTSAARRGASIFKMIDVSRHASTNTLQGYVRDAEIFRDHAGKDLL
jgi:site-specific recombinase XerD